MFLAEISSKFSRLLCQVDPSCFVGVLTLSRPERSNAMDEKMWKEIPQGIRWLEENGARAVGDCSDCCKFIVICAHGRSFCAGLDLSALGSLQRPTEEACEGRSNNQLRKMILELQEAMTACERCICPVIAAVHGFCFGAGIDLITACDIRFCTKDAKLSVKEVDLGIVADMGTLQRLPGIVGNGHARELSLSARTFSGDEAFRLGLVSATYGDQETLLEGALKVARNIAAKSPLALAGTKRVLLHQRDHSVHDGLDYVATWNSGMVRSADMREILAAKLERRAPAFSKL